MIVADVDEYCNDAKTISTEKYLEMHKCDWCQQEFDGSDNAKFCSDVCKRKTDEFLVQSNCEWCYEKIQNRFGDKYCSLDCKEKDFNFLQLEGKRKIVVRILFALGILPASLLIFLYQQLLLKLVTTTRFPALSIETAGFDVLGSIGLACIATLMYCVRFEEEYRRLDRRLHSHGLRKYYGYQCMHLSMRDTGDYRRKSYLTGYCCPGCKYEEISSSETSIRQSYSLLIGILLFFTLLPFGTVIPDAMFMQTTTANYNRWITISFKIFFIMFSLATSNWVCFLLACKEEQREYGRHGMSKSDYVVLNKACEIIRRKAESLPREAEINLKESVFSKDKSMLLEEAKSIVDSYYDNDKENEILCRLMQEKFHKSVYFSIGNVTRKGHRWYEVELKVVNYSEINIVKCSIEVCGEREYVYDINPGKTTVKVVNATRSRVKLSNPELNEFLYEHDGKHNEISMNMLKPEYEDFLKLTGNERAFTS